MRTNHLLGNDINFDHLATETKNYTGAEIEAVCRSATAFALFKDCDLENLGPMDKKGAKTKKPGNKIEERKVMMVDFEHALKEVKPAFGMDDDSLQAAVSGGIINYGPSHEKLNNSLHAFLREIQNSHSTQLLTVLLEGRNGTGKTALAADIALKSGFPFVKMLSPT